MKRCVQNLALPALSHDSAGRCAARIGSCRCQLFFSRSCRCCCCFCRITRRSGDVLAVLRVRKCAAGGLPREPRLAVGCVAPLWLYPRRHWRGVGDQVGHRKYVWQEGAPSHLHHHQPSASYIVKSQVKKIDVDNIHVNKQQATATAKMIFMPARKS